MPDTGAPWNIPFLDGTELVRAYPDFSEDLADAVADGLSAAGGLVAVKHVLKTDPFSASVTRGNNVAVTGMSITHEVADPANRLIITAYFGAATTSASRGNVGISVAEDGTQLAIGDAAGSRTRVGASGFILNTSDIQVLNPSVTFVHTPGPGEKVYTVLAHNITIVTQTVFVNLTESTVDNEARVRSSSALVIQEVKV